MLLELNISDFAIIERLNVRLGAGFNVLTGETGAGKSIIIDALGTLRRVREDLQSLRKAAASRAERIEELRFLLEDVGAAKLRPGEEAELLQERSLVQNGAKITDLVTSAYALLYVGDESG